MKEPLKSILFTVHLFLSFVSPSPFFQAKALLLQWPLLPTAFNEAEL